MSGLSELYPRRFFFETWRHIDEEASEERGKRRRQNRPYDTRPLIALVTAAACLTLMEYFGQRSTMIALLDAFDPREASVHVGFWADLRASQYYRLYEFVWWSGWRVLGYFILPAIVIKSAMRERLVDHGLSTEGFREHAWIYGLFFFVVLIGVVGVSFTDEFSQYYPFYKQASRSWFDFGCWELLYAAQFFSLEFFFRGFILKSCKTMMGSHAIFAMIVPYCMIHYGKPALEAFAAIFAGLVLGTLAMKTRSIWSGFLIHVSVALSMDVAAMLQGRGLPETFWPSAL
ncbi:MAG: CPBP family intramembrane metalloprotease [Sandaracinaceae bacterium]|nr:CPBP family intramembrane metalloprotease [Sandaracinaceae bacterium]